MIFMLLDNGVFDDFLFLKRGFMNHINTNPFSTGWPLQTTQDKIGL